MEMLVSLLLTIVGGALLLAGGEILVKGASRLARLLGLSPLIVGLTVVACGTSAPELTVSLLGALRGSGDSDIAIGNVVGSCICNVLLILGVSAVFRPLNVSVVLIRKSYPFLFFVSIIFWLIAFGTAFIDGVHRLPQLGGGFFLLILIGYLRWTIRSVSREENGLIRQNAEANGTTPIKESGSKAVSIFCSFVFIVVGLALLIFGSNWFIDGAVAIATFLGVSTFVISLTVLAVGTSLPELVVSALAAIRGNSEIALGNVVGSNIFNLLGILGISSLVLSNGLTLSNQAFYFDVPVMIFTSLIGGILCWTGLTLSRKEGAALLLLYLGYLIALFYFGRIA